MSADREAGLHDLPEHLRLSRIDPWAACGSIRTTAVVRTLSHPRTLMAFLDEVEKIMAKLAQARDADEPTWREEWRVCAGPADDPAVFKDGIRNEEHLRVVLRHARNQWSGEYIWSQRRKVRTTDWERVTE